MVPRFLIHAYRGKGTAELHLGLLLGAARPPLATALAGARTWNRRSG
jgi:hypothetical protein